LVIVNRRRITGAEVIRRRSHQAPKSSGVEHVSGATNNMNSPQEIAILPPPIDPGAVSQQLERILTCDEFRASGHLSDFLRFIVEETLAGRSGQIKGYTVAVAVFKRQENFDPTEDPIVRIYAGKLRRALAYYYATAGVDDPVLIEVPKGHYLPTFSLAAPASQARAPVPVERPVIVVLPLANLSSDLEQTYLADGLSEDIMVALTRCQDVEVFAEPAAAGFRWSEVNVRDLATSLDARFFVGGTVRRSGDRVRITVQLRDGITGRQLWADSYDRTLIAPNLFVILDDIASQVVTNVADQFEGVINRTLTSEMPGRTRSLAAYDAVLRLHLYSHVAGRDTYTATRRNLEQAVVSNPEYAMAWAGLSVLQVHGYATGFVDDARDATLSRAFASVRKAMALDPGGEYAHFVLGYIYLVARDRASLLQEAETLISHSRQPSLQALGAWLLALAGHWDRGTEILADRMQALSHLPCWLHHVTFLNEYRQGNYDAAYQASLKFNMPAVLWDPLERAAALGQLGRTTESRKAIGELLALRPDFADHPRRYLECFILQDQLVEHVIDGLRKGGLSLNRPENPATRLFESSRHG
jgi:adenylate cyclase